MVKPLGPAAPRSAAIRQQDRWRNRLHNRSFSARDRCQITRLHADRKCESMAIAQGDLATPLRSSARSRRNQATADTAPHHSRVPATAQDDGVARCAPSAARANVRIRMYFDVSDYIGSLLHFCGWTTGSAQPATWPRRTRTLSTRSPRTAVGRGFRKDKKISSNSLDSLAEGVSSPGGTRGAGAWSRAPHKQARPSQLQSSCHDLAESWIERRKPPATCQNGTRKGPRHRDAYDRRSVLFHAISAS